MITATSATPDISDRTVFRRAARAEWTRLRTLRSTWCCLFAATGLMTFIAAAAGAGHHGEEPAPIWQAAQVAIVPGQFAFLVVVLLAVTSDYATGAIRSSLQWVPRRRVLLLARTLVPVLAVTVCAVLASIASMLVAWGLLGGAAEVVTADIAASLARIALVITFGGLLTMGLGLLLRNTAGTLTAIFLLFLALPIALGNSGVGLLTSLSDRLPGRAIISVIVVDEVELSAGAIATVMVAWTIAAMASGSWSLLTRDTA
jgi:ABC-2 type transport system permease protein